MSCACTGKLVLLLLNTLCCFVGLALVAAGIIVTFLPDTFLSEVLTQAQNAATAAHVHFPKEIGDLNDIPFLKEAGIALLAFGIFLFVVSFLGFCGSCCTSCCKWMLVVFAAVLLILMAGEIVIGTMFYVPGSPIHEPIKKAVKDKISSDFNQTSTNSFSATMFFFHKTFDCCGMDGGKDFGSRPHDITCDPNYEDVGCYTRLMDVVQDNITWAGLALAAVLCVQLLEVIFAIVVYKEGNKVGIA